MYYNQQYYGAYAVTGASLGVASHTNNNNTHTHPPVHLHLRQAFTDPQPCLTLSPCHSPTLSRVRDLATYLARLSASPPVGRLDPGRRPSAIKPARVEGGVFNDCRPLPKSAPVSFVKADSAGYLGNLRATRRLHHGRRHGRPQRHRRRRGCCRRISEHRLCDHGHVHHRYVWAPLVPGSFLVSIHLPSIQQPPELRTSIPS